MAMGVPKNGWFTMEFPSKRDDLGVLPILGNPHILIINIHTSFRRHESISRLMLNDVDRNWEIYGNIDVGYRGGLCAVGSTRG